MIQKLCVGILTIALLTSTTVNSGEKYEYDQLNRLTKVIYQDGSYIEYEYDANGNITHTQVHDVSQGNGESIDSNDDNTDPSNDYGNTNENPYDESGGQTEHKVDDDTEESKKDPSFIDTVVSIISNVADTISNWFKSIFNFR